MIVGFKRKSRVYQHVFPGFALLEETCEAKPKDELGEEAEPED